MMDILKQLCAFNQVKFSAYHTTLRLHALQKRLCCKFLNINPSHSAFRLLHLFIADLLFQIVGLRYRCLCCFNFDNASSSAVSAASGAYLWPCYFTSLTNLSV
ncbi:hypothetical protein niasHS_004410 [Heterodera schachtii]|uniref:EF-hand domain-containing protein n=1 Tax=Heterodera schachtii TaxID=97005 RepID=A0ABD2JKV4_HETSC